MQKITFRNNTTPLLSAENLNAIQDNTENAINNINSSQFTQDDSIGYTSNYINNTFLKKFYVNFTIGSIPGNGDRYDQVYSIPTSVIPEDYTPIAIVGYQLYGGYFSQCPYTSLYLDGRNIVWAMKNTGTNTTGSLGTNIQILAVKTSV